MKTTRTARKTDVTPKSRKKALLLKRAGQNLQGVEAADAAKADTPQAPQAIQLPVETAKVKLSVTGLTPAAMLELLTRIATGMAATPVYATLPVLTDVTGARTALSTVIGSIASLETQLREARITLGQWMEACGMVLNRAAVACENEDSAPSSLVNAGWTLRRGRSPAHDMPSPTKLRLKQTAFAGEGVARWKVVPNANFYEVQVDPVAGAELTIAESVLLKSVRASVALPTVAPGSLVTLCVRAVGAKGAGPFCDALTVRVN